MVLCFGRIRRDLLTQSFQIQPVLQAAAGLFVPLQVVETDQIDTDTIQLGLSPPRVAAGEFNSGDGRENSRAEPAAHPFESLCPVRGTSLRRVG